MGYGQYSEKGIGDALRVKRPDGMKQRRFVFGSHDNTCHVWAQQNAETWEGRAGDGRIKFDGPTIYSYGSHFPMAHFTNGEYEGRRVVLYNDRSYSVSTSKHQGCVRGALHGLPLHVLPVPDLGLFLQWGGPGKEQLNRTWDALLRTWGRAAQNLDAERAEPRYEGSADWATRDEANAAGNVQAFRAVFGKRFVPPRNVRTWYAALVEREEKAAAAKRRRDALRKAIAYKARNITSVALPADLQELNTWALTDKIRDADRTALDLFRVRRDLAPQFKGLKRECSRLLKLAKQAKATLEAAKVGARERAQRAADLAHLKELREYLANPDGARNPQALWNYESTARLWGVALREGMPDLAEALGRHVQLTMWRRECPETFKRFSADDGLTPEQWQAGKGHASASYLSGYTLLRRKGDQLETSRGAVVPWQHAVRAFQAAQRLRAAGEGYKANGHTLHVGHFAVSEIKPDGTLVAGCHVLTWPEMLRLAVREAPEIVRPCYPLPVRCDHDKAL